MARYTGAKNKISRKFGVDLGLKGPKGSQKLMRRLNIPPGQHGPKRKRRKTGYGDQLSEKQKLRYSYGVSERQLRKYYQAASKFRGATGSQLLSLLERRLDNTVYRLGLAPTRAAARQIVSHNHVSVNGKRMNIPSYEVKEGDVITLSNKAISIPSVAELLEGEDKVSVPGWLERKAAAGKILHIPVRDEIDIDANEQVIVEFYSR